MKKLTVLTSLLLALVFFYGLIKFIFNVAGLKFYAELIVLIALLFFALISMLLIFNRVRFGFVIYSLVSAVVLLNLVLIFYRIRVMNTVMFIALVASMTGFVLGVINMGAKRMKKVKVEPYHTFVAKKNGKTFHKEECAFAKKIKKSDRVYFDSEEEAGKEGLKKHNCV